MTGEKLKRVFQFYLEELTNEAHQHEYSSGPEQLSDQRQGLMCVRIQPERALAHFRFMCIEAQRFVDEGRIEKAMRWLGFLQGVLWARNFFTLDDLKNHSRPDGPI